MAEYQLYTVIGIAAVGIIANKIIDYNHRKAIGLHVQRLNELTTKAEQVEEVINRGFQGLFKKLGGLAGKF